MRIVYVADGRSPIAVNWIRYFVERGDEVHLISSFPCRPEIEFASFHVLPLAFSGVKAAASAPAGQRQKRRPGVGVRTRLRQWLGPLTLPGAARRVHDLVAQIQPDLVHAMRVPYEGMAAGLADLGAPLLVSIWGNDFTLHAPATPLMAYSTRSTLRRASALHADCRRDIRLAEKWGFSAEKPAVVLPGAGGIQLDQFYPNQPESEDSSTGVTIANPRGFRAYVRNDTFFRAVPLVLRQRPEARFVCPAMEGEIQAQRWVADFAISDAVQLLPRLARGQMASLFRQAQITVSPSTHDGTPNTLLEAMACGSFPVAGDLESLREWITPGENGLLFDPADPHSLADAILAAIDSPRLRMQAAERNLAIIRARAEYGQVMAEAEAFYRRLIKG